MTGREERETSEETLALLRDYFDAFSNLYGIVPLYRALRIIRKQNPELEMSNEEFLALTESIREEDHYYIIAGREDIYEDVTETPPMKREIILEYIYLNDFDDYEEMRETQEDKPYYIPDKETLLRYADDGYLEKTKELQAMEDFLGKKLKIKNAGDIVTDIAFFASVNTTDPEILFWEIGRLEPGKRPLLEREREEFFRLYTDLHDHTRLRENRGFTNAEMRARTGGGSAEPIGY